MKKKQTSAEKSNLPVANSGSKNYSMDLVYCLCFAKKLKINKFELLDKN